MKIVAITCRGCPAGWLGAYGNEWVATPNLDRLAAAGVVFDAHLACRPDAEAAARAVRTGRHQHPAAADGGPDLYAILRDRGVCVAVVRASRIENDLPPGFYAGRGEVFDARPADSDASPGDALVRALPAVLARFPAGAEYYLEIETDRLLPPWDVPQDVFEVYLEELAEDDREPRAVDPDAVEDEEDDPVLPWADPPTGKLDDTDDAPRELLHRSFAAAVTAFDADLGRVFDVLRTHGADDAVWILTGDFGFPLGEHGFIGPAGARGHVESVHLPLFVRLPAEARGGERVEALTQPADLTATLLTLFGAPVPAGIDGRDLLGPDPGREVAVSGHVEDGTGEWAVRTADWTCIFPVPDDQQPRLYARPDDRWEVNNVRRQFPAAADDLEVKLREIITPTPR